jgi:hypothetical protein
MFHKGNNSPRKIRIKFTVTPSTPERHIRVNEGRICPPLLPKGHAFMTSGTDRPATINRMSQKRNL